MILYTEEQLERAYDIYRVHQIKKDLSFMKLEDFSFSTFSPDTH